MRFASSHCSVDERPVKIDSHRIDQTLELIAGGELDPLQAARNLLGIPTAEQAIEPPPAPLHEPLSVQQQTLDQLVRTLGMPPPEIEHDWRQQILSLAHTWQQTHGVPLPALQLSDLWVDADNRLSLRSETLTAARQAASGHLADEPNQAPPNAPTPAADKFALEPASTSDRVLDSTKASRLSWGRITVAATALAACAAAAVPWGTVFRADAESHGGQARHDTERSIDETSSAATSAAPSAWPARSADRNAAQAGPLAEPLQTLMPPSASPADTAFPADLLDSDDPLLSDVLSGLPAETDLLATAATAPQAAPDPLADEAAADLDDSGTKDDSLEAADIPAVAGDASPPQEAPQHHETRSAAADAVTLPPLPAPGQLPESALVLDSPISELRWEFPQPTTLVLRPLSLDHWNLIDTADGATIASFHSGEQGLEFRWDAQAASRPIARQLPAGRLQLTGPALATPQILWLRPHLKSEPIRFQFTESQASASWLLGGPAVFAAGELTVDVDVPESVEMSWIEPLDPHNLRRSVGLLQWSPANSETPLIRCRLELRLAANLSLKLRYAAQLDPALPWQTFSPEQLERTIDRAAVALNRLLAQQSEIARQYTAASAASRRLLKPARDAVDQNVQRLQMLLQRMQQLIELQTAVATEAQLRIELTTQWPDQQQTILELTGDGE